MYGMARDGQHWWEPDALDDDDDEGVGEDDDEDEYEDEEDDEDEWGEDEDDIEWDD